MTNFILSHLKQLSQQGNASSSAETTDEQSVEVEEPLLPAAWATSNESSAMDRPGAFYRPIENALAARFAAKSSRNEQHFWYKHLTSDVASIPWLWDLDPGLCAQKYGECPGPTWDWKSLIQTLMEENVFEPGGEMHENVPLGLRNRRRIWKIMHEMGGDKEM